MGLIGTMEHSVLGTRHVYDACADPVFVATVLDTIRSGGRQADLRVRRVDGTEVGRDADATARGEGVPTVPRHDPGVPVSVADGTDRTTVTGGGFELTVVRRLGGSPDGLKKGPALTGTFAGGADLRLAIVSG
ncbi:maltokinase N-terminal cap-like domain-containing protein [Nocardioides hwasunensis]|uniref:maltokinase N-terminal cap-like domain-containing protein n=1 Tax=Nocardioides hwasunensis TaxID=397258 RepID=UPI001CD0E954|nr:hypothetical protein [Nocardioides hwasunensis]